MPDDPSAWKQENAVLTNNCFLRMIIPQTISRLLSSRQVFLNLLRSSKKGSTKALALKLEDMNRTHNMRSYERKKLEKLRMPHLNGNKAAEKREREILRKPSAKGDIHANQRKDLTHLSAFAIDKKGTIFPEDAVSYDSKSRTLLVHMADPSAYFLEGSNDPIVNNALKKAKTIYLKETQLPMFSKDLNKRRFSLREKNRMPALTFGIKIQQNGSIRNSVTVKPTYINVTRLSPEEVEDVISTNKDLKRLKKVADKLKDHREEALRSRLRHPPSKNKTRVETNKLLAQDMVNQLMIATKMAAGMYTMNHEIPVLYITSKSDCLNASHSNNINRGNQRCTKLSIDPGRHDSVGADAYVNVTNPLRNAVDLISHMQIKAYLKDKKYPFSRRHLKRYADRFQKMEGTIKRIDTEIVAECKQRGYKNCKRRNS